VRTVCVVITARPSYSRIKTALEAIRERDDLELQLVIAGSALLDRYGSAVDHIRADGFAVAAEVAMVLEGENPTAMAKTTGLGLLELATVFTNLEPDVVVTVADRYETLATAVAATYLNIPLAHVQGGEVSGSIDEKVRHAVTKLADLHFPATDLAAERIVRMGEEPDRVFVTRCPSIDLAARVAKDPDLDYDPFERYGGVGEPLDLTDGYLVVLQHPVTTEHELARQHVTETLRAVHQGGHPTLWFWPNVDAGSDGTSNGIRAYREQFDPANVHFFKNFAPDDFLRLLGNARVLIGNSSVGIRESSFLGVPSVNVGSRQAGRERGANVVDVPYEAAAIAAAVEQQVAHGPYDSDLLYGDGQAGHRIAALLAEAPLTIEKRLAY
jgi:UDP-hydrolysing UDP-N-acetyl-D-glucosamine 2-epimerase